MNHIYNLPEHQTLRAKVRRFIDLEAEPQEMAWGKGGAGPRRVLKAWVAHALQNIPRPGACMLPRHCMGLDFTVDKALHLVTQGLGFGEVVDVVQGGAPAHNKRKGQGKRVTREKKEGKGKKKRGKKQKGGGQKGE